MKSIYILLVSAFFVSCEKNCDEEKNQAKSQYQKSMQSVGNSFTAAQEVTAQYNRKITEINQRCQ